MHKFEPHVDLRSNLKAQYTDESVWPTFTDIMTVVLMIFMFTMVAVLLTNADLARQLITATQEKDVSTRKLGKSIGELQMAQVKITALESDIEKRKMELILLKDETRLLHAGEAAKDDRIDRLERAKAALYDDVRSLKAKVAQAELDMEKASQENSRRLANLAESHKRQLAELEKQTRQALSNLSADSIRRLVTVKQQLAAAQADLGNKEKALKSIQQKEERLELALAKQRSRYSILEDKYNKLIGPARSSLDKTVVSVRYSKQGREHVILFKDVGAKEYRRISQSGLHKRLELLKDQLGLKLYVKVVIPEDSNLSYNEAWAFTNTILTKYDYYYQDKQ